MNKQAKENYQNLWNEFIEVLPTLVRNGTADLVKGYTRKLNSLFTDIFETTDKNPIQIVENHPLETFDNDSIMPDDDMVNNPSHYQSMIKDLNIDCITAMRAAFGDYETAVFCKLNGFKYIWRASSKNGNEDIDKASWYLKKYRELGEEIQ